jgi:hypothetical protein
MVNGIVLRWPVSLEMFHSGGLGGVILVAQISLAIGDVSS